MAGGKYEKVKGPIIEALNKSLGIVDPACRAVGIARKTFYEWKNKYPEFKQAVDEAQEIAKDFAETALFKKINGGNVAAIIFFLKTRAKDRGYVERQEVTGANGAKLTAAPQEINLSITKPKELFEDGNSAADTEGG